MNNKNLEYYLGLDYPMLYEYEPQDSTWIAYNPDLGRGTCYAIGDTKAEALKNLNECRLGLIKMLYDEGKSIPEPYSARDKALKPLEMEAEWITKQG